MTIKAITYRLRLIPGLPHIQAIIVFLMPLWLCAASLTAQEDYYVDIELSNSSPAVNEQFRVDYVLKFRGRSGSFNLSGIQVRQPPFDGFRIADQGGRMDMNMNFGFGRQPEDMSLYRYSFVLEPQNPGRYKIEPLAFIWQGMTLESKPLTIKVKDEDAAQPPARAQRPEDQIGDKDLFARTIVDKREVYTGEPLTVTHKIYARNNITGLDVNRMPSYSGFWTEDVDLGRLQVRQERLNGTLYNVVTLAQKVLYPQQAGELSIDQLKSEVTLEVITTRPPRSRSEQIWYGNQVRVRKNVEKTTSAPALSITVKPFPRENRPQHFREIAGRFEMHTRLTRDTVALNHGTNLKVTLSGKGNIRMLEPPHMEIPPALETYDPHVETHTDVSPGGVSGSRTFDFLIIPQTTGTFTIPPITFSYFDVEKKEYITLESQPMSIYVHEGDGATAETAIGYFPGEEVRHLGTDILYIYSRPFNVYEKGNRLVHSWIYWLTLALFLSIIPAALIIRRKQQHLEADRGLLLTKKATKIAKKRLKHAQRLKKEKQEQAFYEETHRAFAQYLSHRFRIPAADINEDVIQKTLKEKNISDALVQRSIRLIHQCGFARFAPGKNKPGMDTIYDEATGLIREMEYENRKARARAGKMALSS